MTGMGPIGAEKKRSVLYMLNIPHINQTNQAARETTLNDFNSVPVSVSDTLTFYFVLNNFSVIWLA